MTPVVERGRHDQNQHVARHSDFDRAYPSHSGEKLDLRAAATASWKAHEPFV